MCVDISSSVVKADVWHGNCDFSPAADIRGLMCLKAFIAQGQVLRILLCKRNDITKHSAVLFVVDVCWPVIAWKITGCRVANGHFVVSQDLTQEDEQLFAGLVMHLTFVSFMTFHNRRAICSKNIANTCRQSKSHLKPCDRWLLMQRTKGRETSNISLFDKHLW